MSTTGRTPDRVRTVLAWAAVAAVMGSLSFAVAPSAVLGRHHLRDVPLRLIHVDTSLFGWHGAAMLAVAMLAGVTVRSRGRRSKPSGPKPPHE